MSSRFVRNLILSTHISNADFHFSKARVYYTVNGVEKHVDFSPISEPYLKHEINDTISNIHARLCVLDRQDIDREYFTVHSTIEDWGENLRLRFSCSGPRISFHLLSDFEQKPWSYKSVNSSAIPYF